MKQFTDEEVDAKNADAIRAGITQSGDDLAAANEPPEMRQAKELARRYRLPFVNLLPQDGESPIDYSLLSEVPVDLMVRHQFVPLRRTRPNEYSNRSDDKRRHDPNRVAHHPARYCQNDDGDCRQVVSES